ncbi:hypothetical protein SELMODRAFT_450678 [Selaginella moellendorffii]|uniref:Uncharacterized protein n=1 Tax=Selaginella moellendorffii TaxID=88036 RepID=D8T0I9_SELML|nr:hypothetical protein SELMODRAFT_450678 [Selaginella moellendorffii]
MMMMRRAAQRLTGGGVLIRRTYADTRGVLSEEEKAAENMYIKRMEREKLEKARMKASEEEASSAASSASTAAQEERVPKADPDLPTKSIAMGAGLVAVACAVYFMFSSPPSGKKTAESKVEES